MKEEKDKMLNNIPPKILFWMNIIVMILFTASIFFFLTEIYYMKEYGGQCMDNPTDWAEKYMREEKGILVDCSCERIIDLTELNLTGG